MCVEALDNDPVPLLDHLGHDSLLAFVFPNHNLHTITSVRLTIKTIFKNYPFNCLINIILINTNTAFITVKSTEHPPEEAPFTHRF